MIFGANISSFFGSLKNERRLGSKSKKCSYKTI